MTTPTTGTDATPRAGGPPPWIAILAIGGLLFGALLIGLQLVGVRVGPAVEPTMAPPGAAARRTWDQVAATLQAQSFQVQVPVSPYRPGESPELIGVPRSLLQVVLPSTPTGTYVVVYELPTNGDAERVGRDFAAYLASGTGAIQYPRDTQFVIQRVGATIVFFAWSAEANPDPQLATIASALQTLGTPLSK